MLLNLNCCGLRNDNLYKGAINVNKDFARIITFLRKEKKLSQKQAAQELGISQALLSHYEKGIRECGLDFVIKAADYYNVSCDYLLGRTADRDYEAAEPVVDKGSKKQSAAQVVSRRLIANMLNAIYDMAATAKNRRLDRTVTNYFMLEAYRVFRYMYSANPENSRGLFTVADDVYSGYAGAAMEKLRTDIRSMCDAESDSCLKALTEEEYSPEKLAQEYPDTAGEIFNVIHQAENVISRMKN